MAERTDMTAIGLQYEELRRYIVCVAMAPDHPLARKRSLRVAQAAAQPLVGEVFRQFAGKRLAYRRFSDSEESHGVGIARAAKGDVTPAGEKFCAALRLARIFHSARKVGWSFMIMEVKASH